jgi:hypothetical protein
MRGLREWSTDDLSRCQRVTEKVKSEMKNDFKRDWVKTRLSRRKSIFHKAAGTFFWREQGRKTKERKLKLK